MCRCQQSACHHSGITVTMSRLIKHLTLTCCTADTVYSNMDINFIPVSIGTFSTGCRSNSRETDRLYNLYHTHCQPGSKCNTQQYPHTPTKYRACGCTHTHKLTHTHTHSLSISLSIKFNWLYWHGETRVNIANASEVDNIQK